MSFDVETPERLGPRVVARLDRLIQFAQASAGKPALSRITEELSHHYRALAICLFADDGNIDDFFHWLLHSPLARWHYLNTVHAPALGEPRGARAGHVEPLLDAIAARQWTLATRIATQQQDHWLQGEEYEEDFCYGDFLRCVLLGHNTDALLGRWFAALEGNQDKRLEVARAIRAKNAEQFESALRDLLRAAEARARALADPLQPSMLAEELTFAPNRWVSVEGLALLALAEREEISTDFAIEGCASTARFGVYAPFRSRAYPDLDLPTEVTAP